MSAPTHPGKLPRKMHVAIAALLVAPTEAAAAAQAGVAAATLRRWKKRPEFRDALHAASRERLGDTVARLRAAAAEAVETLCEALHDKLTSNRVRAAIAILDVAVRIEVDDLGRRVTEMESVVRPL